MPTTELATIHDYNLAAVQVSLKGFRVDGWGATDAIALAPMSDLHQSEVSGDGTHVAISAINDPRWEATLTVRRGTSAFRQLMEAAQAMVAESRAGTGITAIPFQVYDPSTGTKISDRAARFKRWPDLDFGSAASEAEFVLLLPSPTVVAGANIAITA